MTLREMRTSRGITQFTAAKSLNTTQGAVCQWETGTAYPHSAKIPKLAELYGVTETDIHNACTAAYEQRRHTAQESSEQEVES